jgi:outer membrane murein-binding lipoprotein Lpp
VIALILGSWGACGFERVLVGIGTATLVIGAVAQRFLAGEVEAAEMAEHEVLSEISDIAARLAKLEQALQARRRTS